MIPAFARKHDPESRRGFGVWIPVFTGMTTDVSSTFLTNIADKVLVLKSASYFSSPTRINGAQKYGCEVETEASGEFESQADFTAGISPNFPTPPMPRRASKSLVTLPRIKFNCACPSASTLVMVFRFL